MFSHIMTYSGKLININELTDKDIDIVDIAHALSNKCRFGGHTKEFYSVAQHSLLVEKAVEKVVGIPGKVEELKLRLTALLHDSTEAYIPDFASPMKCHFFFQRDVIAIPQTIAELERSILTSIGWALQLPFLALDEYKDEIHRLDQIALVTEAQNLLPSTEGFSTEYLPLADKVEPLSPEAAETAFIAKYNELVERLSRSSSKKETADTRSSGEESKVNRVKN